jgi:hypothetical protein
VQPDEKIGQHTAVRVKTIKPVRYYVATQLFQPVGIDLHQKPAELSVIVTKRVEMI